MGIPLRKSTRTSPLPFSRGSQSRAVLRTAAKRGRSWWRVPNLGFSLRGSVEVFAQQPLGVAVEDIVPGLVRDMGKEDGARVVMLAVPGKVASEHHLVRSGSFHH